MDRVSIDKALCNGCGTCVRVCPHDTLGIKEQKAVLIREKCFLCGHCKGVCPMDALIIPGWDDQLFRFNTFSTPESSLAPGKGNISDLVHIMQSRRSCRNYLEKGVPEPYLKDLVKVGVTAPSGSNSQKWTFTLLPERTDVLALAEGVGRFYERISRLSEKFWLRKALRIIGRPGLDDFYREHYPSVQKALCQWRKSGRDLLFHGAPSAILVGSEKGASCPLEDAMLATQNILLAAHVMGLGTCLIGFASIAMNRDKSIQKSLGINTDETVCSVIAMGYPDIHFQRKCGRRKVSVSMCKPKRP